MGHWGKSERLDKESKGTLTERELGYVRDGEGTLIGACVLAVSGVDEGRMRGSLEGR